MALYISMKIRGLGVLVIINRFVILSFIEKKIWLDFNMYWWTKNWLSCDVFNVGRATQWAFADSRLGVNPKADPETIGLSILTLKQVAKGEAITFLRCPDQRYYWQGTWRALHPRRILHAPVAIRVHDDLQSAASFEPSPPVSSPKLYQMGYLGP